MNREPMLSLLRKLCASTICSLVKAKLEARKIYVTSGESMELPGYLRVSYGLPKENQIFLNNLSEILTESAVKTPV